MRFDKDSPDLKSLMGALCSIILAVVTLAYAVQKADVLINRRDVDVLSTINDMEIAETDMFNYNNGFNIAVGFTAYDSNTEPILEPSIGELVFNHFTWGEMEDGTYGTTKPKIETHPCTREELGLTEDRS